MKAEVVDQLPENPDLSTFYFVTYDGGIDPPEEGYLTKDEANRYYQPIGNYLSSSLLTNESADIVSGEVLLPTAKAIKEYVEQAIAISAKYFVVNGMYPVGSIYMSISATLPSELCANGMEWTKIRSGYGFWTVSADTELNTYLSGILPKHYHPTKPSIDGSILVDIRGITTAAKYDSGGVNSGTGSIDSTVKNVKMGTTLRPPSYGINAWRRTK